LKIGHWVYKANLLTDDEDDDDDDDDDDGVLQGVHKEEAMGVPWRST